jgi:hypothetical protein
MSTNARESRYLSRTVGAAQAEHHFEMAAPVNAEPDSLYFNFRSEMAENASVVG